MLVVGWTSVLSRYNRPTCAAPESYAVALASVTPAAITPMWLNACGKFPENAPFELGLVPAAVLSFREAQVARTISPPGTPPTIAARTNPMGAGTLLRPPRPDDRPAPLAADSLESSLTAPVPTEVDSASEG